MNLIHEEEEDPEEDMTTEEAGVLEVKEETDQIEDKIEVIGNMATEKTEEIVMKEEEAEGAEEGEEGEAVVEVEEMLEATREEIDREKHEKWYI